MDIKRTQSLHIQMTQSFAAKKYGGDYHRHTINMTAELWHVKNMLICESSSASYQNCNDHVYAKWKYRVLKLCITDHLGEIRRIIK